MKKNLITLLIAAIVSIVISTFLFGDQFPPLYKVLYGEKGSSMKALLILGIPLALFWALRTLQNKKK